MPKLLFPQQNAVRSVCKPQVCLLPALRCVNEFDGGLDWPSPFAPQQVTVPSLRKPQVCLLPALSWVNESDGGLD